MNVPSWWVDAYDPTKLNRSLADLADCGGDWIALVPTWYQNSMSSTDIQRTQRTLSDSNLVSAIEMANSQGFRLMLKPHVDIESGGWRANIDPSDLDAWFASYRKMILRYADMCEQYGVERLCIGTELTSMSDKPQWSVLIDSVKTHYSGELTFAADWNGVHKCVFWDKMDYAGIDFYGPLASRESDNIEVYLKNICEWFDRLDGFAEDVDIPIIITEIGFRSTLDAAKHPWEWLREGTPDQAVQAECYRVVLETFPRKPWLKGIYFWMWNPDPVYISPEGYSPQGKKAEEVLKEFWR